MDRYTIIFFLLIFFPVSTNAMNLSSSGSGTGEECPEFISDANVVLGWDGNSSLGHNYMCASDGTPLLADADTVTTGIAYGENGSVGMLIDAGSQYLQWNQTAKQYLDQDGSQTICMRVYLDALPDGYPRIFSSLSAETSDFINLIPAVDNDIRILFYTLTGPDVDARDAGPTVDAWSTVGGAWDTPSVNSDLSATNDGANWDEDADEISAQMDNDLINMTIGNAYAVDPGVGADIFIDKFALIDAYEADCTALTGW